ncbi:hypothetical protein P7K49_021936 [Saguinus oedipus]|uniref:Uncharacterized protein n=1 Tax=Saguinus oedipus TaxID=9490 RepID=A0ABQ9UU28_SAGOE|nr:hypothetical protein P7K49_021936 [Saguinus oedipus]
MGESGLRGAIFKGRLCPPFHRPPGRLLRALIRLPALPSARGDGAWLGALGAPRAASPKERSAQGCRRAHTGEAPLSHCHLCFAAGLAGAATCVRVRWRLLRPGSAPAGEGLQGDPSLFSSQADITRAAASGNSFNRRPPPPSPDAAWAAGVAIVSPEARVAPGDGAETRDAPPSPPPWSNPWRSLLTPRSTCFNSHSPPSSQAGTPTPSSHDWGSQAPRNRAAETRWWCSLNAAQLRALPRRSPNKSPAFNYSARLILMQLPGGGGREAAELAEVSGGGRFSTHSALLSSSFRMGLC